MGESTRRLEVVYSTPKENDDDRPDADTLFVAKRGDDKPVRDDGESCRRARHRCSFCWLAELKALFQQYGDVKRIGATPRTHLAKFVQFYDVRCLAKGACVLRLCVCVCVLALMCSVQPCRVRK